MKILFSFLLFDTAWIDSLYNFLTKVLSWIFEGLFGCLHNRVVLFVIQKNFEEFYKSFDLSSFLDYIEHSLIAQDFQQHYLVGIQHQYNQTFPKLYKVVKQGQV